MDRKTSKFNVGDTVVVNVRGTVESINAVIDTRYGIRINGVYVIDIPESAVFPVDTPEQRERDTSKDAKEHPKQNGTFLCPRCGKELAQDDDENGEYLFCDVCYGDVYNVDDGTYRTHMV